MPDTFHRLVPGLFGLLGPLCQFLLVKVRSGPEPSYAAPTASMCGDASLIFRVDKEDTRIIASIYIAIKEAGAGVRLCTCC